MQTWPPKGEVVRSSLVVKTDRDRVVAEVSKDAGWPWIEVDFPDKNGKLLICGFGIIRSWDAGPAPRFLLARLFEFLTDRKQPRQLPQTESKE